ncbi:MFS transporter [Sporolactobacillus inulinus]|uniref:Major facilitator superfamily (MFS) profile domain-containing protein n=1 Tax=Sporolactobacillus inulinus CASD TaxID=1069536 RepID=A0A0U1QQH7_9BACL|nr:MFS transporter [Sporolactobacillus inulinus]KLI02886.1 hypothetical protein SINU_05670 [Sporolactobacillus inulinus CASD]GEB77350.1 MFS transporter [Sporolactobacillus inulinus]
MNALVTNKNFIALFFGRLISNIGDSLYYIAAMWLAYELGGSAFYAGLAGFLTLLPECLSFLAGPIVDRLSLKKMLVIPSILQGLLLMTIPTLYLFHLLTVTAVLIIMPLVALIDLFPYPAEDALIPRLVPQNQLVAANSGMSFSYQGTDLIFSLSGGLLILLTGAVNLYLIDALTFFVAATFFATIRLKWPSQKEARPPFDFSTYRADLAAGFRFVIQPLNFTLLLPLLAINFFLSAVLAALPSFANQLGGPEKYGILLTCYTLGFLLGTLTSSFVSRRLSMGKALIYGYACSSLMWLLAACAADQSFVLCCAFIVLANLPVGATNIMFNTFFQVTPPQDMIGRVSAVIETLIAAAMPLGALFGGAIAAWLGNTPLLVFQGAVVLITALVWMMNKRLRRIPRLEGLNGL